MADPYPRWCWFPQPAAPPAWVDDVVAVVVGARPLIDSSVMAGVSSDTALGHLRPGLERLGFEVEGGKGKAQKIVRPVLFGDQGRAEVVYEVDAVHDELGILVEIEAGRGAMSNAIERDLVRGSLIVGARYLVLGVMDQYKSTSMTTPVPSYANARRLLSAIYASGRLRLPFEGVLLFGY